MVLLSLLRRLWNRPPSPAITHTLVCGASRSGKSEAELVRLVALACQNDCSIVLLDPPGTLASKFLLHLHALGLDSRVIYDRLADTDRIPGYEWLTPSSHSDLLQREAENDERIREFTAILLRRRGIQDSSKTPLIEEMLLASLHIYLCQDSPCPLPWIANVFDRGSRARSHLLAHCTDPSLVRKFLELAALSPTAFRAEIGPAERILRAVLTSPAFRVRSGEATFDLGRFFNEKGILILDGSSKGNLSRDAVGVMMGAVLLRVIQHCRGGSRSKVVLVLDEAVNADLLGVHESRALAEAGKWGLEFHILIQNPFSFGSEEIRSNVLQNCWRHEWFRQGSPEAARLAAEDIAIPLLNPLKVHHTEYRHRSADAGFKSFHTTSGGEWMNPDGKTSRNTSWKTVLLPRRKELKDAQDRYMALQDQVMLTQKELMLLRPGFRFVRSDKSASAPEYVPMMNDPPFGVERWTRKRGGRDREGDGEEKMHYILNEIKQRPMFRSACVSPIPANISKLKSPSAAKSLFAKDKI